MPEARKYTEAQKKSAKKWDAANLDRISVAAPKGSKDKWKALAVKKGVSLNQFIVDTIEMKRDTSQEATERPMPHFEGAGVSLSSKTLKAVQEASEATGETQTEFVTRAVGIQVQRDKATLKLGINPATGDKLKQDSKGGVDHE